MRLYRVLWCRVTQAEPRIYCIETMMAVHLDAMLKHPAIYVLSWRIHECTMIAPRQQGKSLVNDLLKRYDQIQSAIEDEMLRKEYACKSCGCDTRLFGCFCDNTQ